MTLLNDINRVLRDFERYTGDGKPGAPTAAPLPTGDPSSGVHNPSKHDLRALLKSIAEAIGDPEALDDLRQQIGQASRVYASRGDAQAAVPSLPASVTQIMVQEGTALVLRSRGASSDDPLMPGAWGVVQRLDVAEEARIRESQIAEKAGRQEMLAETFDALGVLVFDDGRAGTTDIEVWEDADGYPIRRMDADGYMHLPHHARPLQKMIFDSGGAGVVGVEDVDGSQVWALQDDGHLRLPLLDMSVQHGIAAASQRTLDLARTPAHRFTSMDMLFLDVTRGYAGAPPPLNCYPTNWKPGSGWVNEISFPTPAPTPVDTPYGMEHGVVHPSIVEFYAGFRGYRYLMGITGYGRTEEQYENPFILGSNDLQEWALLDGFQQPLAHRPDVPSGHLSDVHLTHDPRSGQLICVWRQSVRLDGAGSDNSRIQDSLFYRATSDGYYWTPPRLMRQTLRSEDGMLSPSLLYDPTAGLWHLYTPDSIRVHHRTARELTGPWSASDVIEPPAGVQIWHMEVRWCGDRLVMLCNDYARENLLFATSTDWTTWSFGSDILTTAPAGAYKGSFVPEIVGSTWRPVVVWTSNTFQSGNRDTWWRLYVAAPADFLSMEP